jgi:hypothetical protein
MALVVRRTHDRASARSRDAGLCRYSFARAMSGPVEQGQWCRLGWLTQTQAAPFISDFKAASTSGGGTLSRDEFMAACSKGLIRDSAVSAPGSTQQ